jgi:hypothetical protein
MSRHRYCLPAPPPAAPAVDAFVMLPLAALPVAPQAWQFGLYEWAFAQAQAVVQPSIVERDLLGVWN